MADVIAANTSPHVVWRRTDSGQIALSSTHPVEQAILEIDSAEATARLAINDAMRKQRKKMSVLTIDEAKMAIHQGAALLQTTDGEFLLRKPGEDAVSVERDAGEQLAKHPVMKRAGKDSNGRINFCLRLGATFDGTQPRPRLASGRKP